MKIPRKWLTGLPGMSIAEVVYKIGLNSGDKPFLYFYDRLFTFREFNHYVEIWRDAMWGHGFKENERALIFAENSPLWCEIYLAVISAGGVAIPIDSHLSGRHLLRLLRHSRASVIFTSPACVDKVMEVIDEVGVPLKVVLIDKSLKEYRGPIGREKFLSESVRRDDVKRSPDDVCTIFFTSGTTGSPKAVPLTHRNLLSGVAMAARLSGLREDDCVLNPLPLYHVFPLVSGFLLSYCMGVGFSLTHRVDRSDLNHAVTHHPVSILMCVPAFYEVMAHRMKKGLSAVKGSKAKLIEWLSKKRFTGRALAALVCLKKMMMGKAVGPWTKLRLFVSGGAPLNHDVMDVFDVLGLPLMEGYGLTETCGAVSMNTFRYNRVGSVGRIFNDWVEIEIDNPNEDGVGEILMRGPTVTMGYDGLDRSDYFTQEGFFHTGDLGRIDTDGFLYVTGRLKDVIVPASGKNIYPVELEEHYKNSPLVKDLCIFGLPEKGGKNESIHASIIATDQLMAHGEEVAYEWLATEIDRLSSELPAYKRIKSFNIWRGDFPRAGTGKVKKFEVKDRVIAFVQGGQEPVVSVDDELLMTHPEAHNICDMILELAPRKTALFPNTSFTADLGFDSLRSAQLIERLEKHYNRRFPRDLLMQVRTVKDAVALFEAYFEENIPLEAEEEKKGLSVTTR